MVVASLGVLLVLMAVVAFRWWKNASKREDPARSQILTEHLDERDFAARIRLKNKNAICIYSSQTGTAHRFAIGMAREIKVKCGISPIVVDILECGPQYLDAVPPESIVCFIVATYGEGEPADSGREFHDFIAQSRPSFSMGSETLTNLRYCIFGCGNRSYEHFNQAAIDLDYNLRKLLASRVGLLGLGDDNSNIEEDFLDWKETICSDWENRIGSTSSHAEVVESDFLIEHMETGDAMEHAFHGELDIDSQGRQPFPAPVLASKELFHHSTHRNCIHTEINIAGSTMSYQAGDHVGMWPCNPEIEVNRILAILGLSEGNRFNQVIEVEALDPTLAPIPIPTPSTILAIFRHYLDVSCMPSRSGLASLAMFAPTVQARSELLRITSTREIFELEVVRPCLKFAEALMVAAGDDITVSPCPSKITPWSDIPMSTLISILPCLQPRYYSISSSPRLHPGQVHITSVVVRDAVDAIKSGDEPRWLHGLNTGYILQLKHAMSRSNEGRPASLTTIPLSPTYHLDGPRSSYRDGDGFKIPVHIRHSTFRLPRSPLIPVIMIGPGTGVAPFRAFVQDRVALSQTSAESGISQWAPIHLFYGCRHSKQDFLYKDEWPVYAEKLDGKFKMHCAFSREDLKPDGTKTYVQDLLWDAREEISRLILQEGAYVYICGDAKHMAKAVEAVLRKMLSDAKGGTADVEGARELKVMRQRRRLLLDVWG